MLFFICWYIDRPTLKIIWINVCQIFYFTIMWNVSIIKYQEAHWPEDAAREQDLVVLLLGRTSIDCHAVFVIHFDMVPHIVGRRDWSNMVYLYTNDQESIKVMKTWEVKGEKKSRQKRLDLRWPFFLWLLVIVMLCTEPSITSKSHEAQQASLYHLFPFLFTQTQSYHHSVIQYINPTKKTGRCFPDVTSAMELHSRGCKLTVIWTHIEEKNRNNVKTDDSKQSKVKVFRL